VAEQQRDCEFAVENGSIARARTHRENASSSSNISQCFSENNRSMPLRRQQPRSRTERRGRLGSALLFSRDKKNIAFQAVAEVSQLAVPSEPWMSRYNAREASPRSGAPLLSTSESRFHRLPMALQHYCQWKPCAGEATPCSMAYPTLERGEVSMMFLWRIHRQNEERGRTESEYERASRWSENSAPKRVSTAHTQTEMICAGRS
jgi:hypothetical protein